MPDSFHEDSRASALATNQISDSLLLTWGTLWPVDSRRFSPLRFLSFMSSRPNQRASFGSIWGDLEYGRNRNERPKERVGNAGNLDYGKHFADRGCSWHFAVGGGRGRRRLDW